jgi:DNA-binding NarL/FixJ family response regulator
MITPEFRESTPLLTDIERQQIVKHVDNLNSNALPIDTLSKRELQVARKIMEGLSNKAIAAELFISERTVKFHCANIYKKLKISSRTALIASCFRSIYHPLRLA